MDIFVTGASGYIGSAVVRDLIGAGHEVTGLARSDAAAASVAAAGARVHRGSLDDPDSLRAGAVAAAGVIHTAFTNVSATTDFAASCRADLAAIQVLGEALTGSGKPLITTSGTGLLAPGALAAEDSGYNPAWPRELRVASEDAALSLAGRGVRSAVLRLPFSVHGEGDARGFVTELIAVARSKGVSAYVGDGANRWPAVHRGDAARLFRLAAESAPAGSRLHGVADEGVPFRDIAAVIGRHLGLPARGISPEEAQEHFGFLAMFTGMDGPASSAQTRELLDWAPAGPALIPDIEAGHYFRAEGLSACPAAGAGYPWRATRSGWATEPIWPSGSPSVPRVDPRPSAASVDVAARYTQSPSGYRCSVTVMAGGMNSHSLGLSAELTPFAESAITRTRSSGCMGCPAISGIRGRAQTTASPALS
jgi:nucleoside-diphosphate-sugar epimerase